MTFKELIAPVEAGAGRFHACGCPVLPGELEAPFPPPTPAELERLEQLGSSPGPAKRGHPRGFMRPCSCNNWDICHYCRAALCYLREAE